MQEEITLTARYMWAVEDETFVIRGLYAYPIGVKWHDVLRLNIYSKGFNIFDTQEEAIKRAILLAQEHIAELQAFIEKEHKNLTRIQTAKEKQDV